MFSPSSWNVQIDAKTHQQVRGFFGGACDHGLSLPADLTKQVEQEFASGH
jgi:hypothetical protein